MKNKILSFCFLVLLIGVSATSCKKYLDINQNPNAAVNSTPQLLLPQAITATATYLSSYNNYAAQSGMYMANSGGYGGFGAIWTYNYSVGDFNSLWDLFDVNNDFNLAKNLSEDDPALVYYNAMARIMLAHNFQLLVDTYNSIPYSEALQGTENTKPAFDDPADIYADLAVQLDNAIALINEGQANAGVSLTPTAGQDPMFGGNMNLWKQFANTVKLRLMVTGNGKVTFGNQSFDGGFLTTDALINPGYVRDNGKQNPKWNTWGFAYTGADGNKAYQPSTFIMGFFDGTKLLDDGRGGAVYYKFPGTFNNRMGVNIDIDQNTPGGSFWYPSSNRDGKSAGDTTGVLKGPNAGIPVITAGESYLLQAEAALNGIITGDVEQLFNDGILASYKYLYQLPDKSISGEPEDDFATYQDDNSNSYLVNFDLASTNDQKLEAIITQKFIAMNMVNSNQAWNDYRRTLYPKLNNAAGADGYGTFASTQSQSARVDKLPTRVAYPAREIANNPNTPTGISALTSLIFWAKP